MSWSCYPSGTPVAESSGAFEGRDAQSGIRGLLTPGPHTTTACGSAILKKLTCDSGGRSGTFTVKFNPQNIPGPGDQNGPWTVKEGTDDFSDLSGGGDFWVIGDETAQSGVETLTGEIQFRKQRTATVLVPRASA